MTDLISCVYILTAYHFFTMINTNTFGKTLIAFRTQIPFSEIRVPSQTSSISHESKYRFANLCKFDPRIPTQILSISDESKFSSARFDSNRIEFCSIPILDSIFEQFAAHLWYLYLIDWFGLWNIINKINSYQKSDYYYYCGWSLHCCDE